MMNKNYLKFFYFISNSTEIFITLFVVDKSSKIIDEFSLKGNMNSIFLFKIILFFLIFLFLKYFNSFIRELIYRYYHLENLSFYFNKTLKRNFYFFRENSLDELYSIFISDLSYMNDWLSVGKIELVNQVLKLLIFLGLIFMYKVEIFLFILFLFLGNFFISRFINYHKASYVADKQEINKVSNKKILSTFNNFSLIYQLDKQEYFLNSYRNFMLNTFWIVNKKIAKFNSFSISQVVFFNEFFPLLVLVLSLYYIGNNQLTIGSGIALFELSCQFLSPMQEIFSIYSQYQIYLKIKKKIAYYL